MALDFPNTPSVGQSFTGIDATVWTWDGVKWVAGSSGSGLNDVGRNLVHNSMFNVAQRGPGPFAATGLSLDRWHMEMSVDASNVAQAAMGDTGRAQIGDEAASNFVNFTVGGTTTGYTVFWQSIEDVRRLAGKTVTVSFWAVANAGSYKVGVSIDQSFGTGGSPSANVSGNGQAVTITSTAWTRYSLTFTIPSVTGKTVGTNGNSSTALLIWLSAGSAAVATRAGNIGVQNGSPNIWGVQLEIGSVATPLEKPDPQQDLAKCQRFYWVGRIYAYAYQSIAVTLMGTSWPFPTQMRAAPTLAVTSNGSTNLNAGTMLFAPLTGGIFAQGTSVAAGPTSIDLSFTASADL